MVEADDLRAIVFEAPDADVELFAHSDEFVSFVNLVNASDGLTMGTEASIDVVNLVDSKEDNCAL